jgi:PIN domain nuclease of toxin-antitoxin system
MKLLLDTHTFIWWDSNPSKLSAKVLTLCQDPTHIKILSVVSIWEMQIKLQTGKLKLNLPLTEIISSQQEINNFQILPLNLTHVLNLELLPFHHKDPFDRMLIAQAKIADASLISCDAVFAQYEVNVVW